jgi:hypothetical protein
MGADWTKLSDFELFCILYSNVNKDICKLFLPDIDLTAYKVYSEKVSEEQSEIVLYNEETQDLLRNMDYLEIS